MDIYKWPSESWKGQTQAFTGVALAALLYQIYMRSVLRSESKMVSLQNCKKQIVTIILHLQNCTKGFVFLSSSLQAQMLHPSQNTTCIQETINLISALPHASSRWRCLWFSNPVWIKPQPHLHDATLHITNHPKIPEVFPVGSYNCKLQTALTQVANYSCDYYFRFHSSPFSTNHSLLLNFRQKLGYWDVNVATSVFFFISTIASFYYYFHILPSN